MPFRILMKSPPPRNTPRPCKLNLFLFKGIMSKTDTFGSTLVIGYKTLTKCKMITWWVSLFVARSPNSGDHKDKCRWWSMMIVCWSRVCTCHLAIVILYVYWAHGSLVAMFMAIPHFERQTKCGCLVAFLYLYKNTSNSQSSKSSASSAKHGDPP